jgi:hypothetical protein
MNTEETVANWYLVNSLVWEIYIKGHFCIFTIFQVSHW